MEISFVQDWGAPLNADSVASREITGPITTAGNTLFIDITLREGSNRPTQVTIVDDASNSWELVGSHAHSSANGFMYMAQNAQPVTSVNVSWFNDQDEPVVAPSIVMLSEFSNVGLIAAPVVTEAITTGSGGMPSLSPVAPGQLMRSMMTVPQSERTWELSTTGIDAEERANFRGNLASLFRADAIAVEPGEAAIGWNRLTGGSIEVVIINVVFSVGEPLPPVEQLSMSGASGWTSVVGEGSRIAAISDDFEETYIETAENPDDEVLQLTLPALMAPNEDLTVYLQLSTSSAPGNIIPELYVPDTDTWVASSTILVAGPANTYTAVWPSSSIVDVTPQQWADGVNIRLIAQVD